MTTLFSSLLNSEEKILTSMHVYPKIWKQKLVLLCHSETISPLCADEN